MFKTRTKIITDHMINILKEIDQFDGPFPNSLYITYNNLGHKIVRPIIEELSSFGYIKYSSFIEGNNEGKMYLDLELTNLGKSILD